MDTSYDEEEIINYEVGLKGQYLDNSLHLGIAAFYYEHDSLQELQLTGQPAPAYELHTSDAEGHGAEIEALWLASPRFTLAGNYSYVDPEYSHVSSIDAAAEPWSDRPQHKVNLSLQYAWQVADLGLLIPRLDSTWVDERRNAGSGPCREVDAFTVTSARVTWLPGAGNWELALWSTNLFDEEAYIDSDDNGSVIGALTRMRIPPRMYGADFVYHF
jgi:iron complex outermembrane receptor protein